MDRLASYTIANRFPVKVLHNNVLRDGKILPVHLRLFPTNKCNSGCSYCEYRNVKRDLELSFEEIKNIIRFFSCIGTIGVSITGGGEPTMHPNFSEIVKYCLDTQMRVGVETNGIRIASGEVKPPEGVSWYRLSLTDPSSGKYPLERISQFAKHIGNTKWGVSVAIPASVNMETLVGACRIVDTLPTCLYIRFNQEFTAPAYDPTMQNVVETLTGISEKAMFSWRANAPCGEKDCRAGMLRPVVAADGYLYPCTNVQLFHENGNRDNPEHCRLGRWDEYYKMSVFDGSKCWRCFYENVNKVLDWLVYPPDDKEFI
jgi:hypothetical protein